MSRLKILSILAGIIATLALSATPAFAEFTSTAKPAQSRGEIKVIIGSVFKDEGLEVICPAEEIKAQYHIQAKGQIKQQQKETTKGPDLNIQVKQWGNCKGLGVKGTEIKPCDLRQVQRQSTAASLGVSESCIIKLPGDCELLMPVGMETAKETDQGINVGLKEVSLENFTTNLREKLNITSGGLGQRLGEGIFVIQVPKHPLCPVTTNENAVLSLEFEAVGVNA